VQDELKEPILADALEAYHDKWRGLVEKDIPYVPQSASEEGESEDGEESQEKLIP
jgi:hypothetical protein